MSESIKGKGKEKVNQTAHYLYAVGLIGLSSLLTYYLADNLHLLNKSLVPWSIASALFYIVGIVADKVSTIKISNAVKESETLGIPQNIRETNPLLPDLPTKKDILSPKILALEAGVLIPSVIFPPFGAYFGISGFYSAIHNTRLYMKIKRGIDHQAK